MKKQFDTIKKPQFEPFTNPNGITLEEYIKDKKNNENSKFSSFPDPNGIPYD